MEIRSVSRHARRSFSVGVRLVVVVAVLVATSVASAMAEQFEGGSFCTYDLQPGVSEPHPAVRHCTCTADLAYFINSDDQFDRAIMWSGPGLAPGSGMFAEYFETPDERPGAVCILYLRITSLVSSLRTSIDLYVWDDDGGRPGEVLGILPELPLFSIAPYPAVGTRDWDIYERMPIGVQGGFWLGLRGNWDPEGCSVLLPIDTFDDDPKVPALRRDAVTYVGPGVDELSEGWHPLEDIVGVPAATGINAVIGWCPVPVLETSWGQIKSLYLGDER
ncbi:MAG: hypothetical protein KDA27_10855 [Candidatus Eisenbacteria bacterium]|uniref:Uncharacterized protein n=1 Tax=Eiseniibacteriota bacterium TaxID=2212470 RepID=A0A956SEF8_UNCEI|nr:hypothetical protein [Candidatus Eisenbacteria bacterium]MCB9463327.1 hypothetical protein [Candidatus Eisenbacteria bacterium]